MLTPDLLFDYQKKAVNHQCTHPESMLWCIMDGVQLWQIS